MSPVVQKKAFKSSSGGQATTEYLLLLLIAFALYRILVTSLGPKFALFYEVKTRQLEQSFSKGLHTFR